MPSERRGTVTEDIVGYLRRISGSSEWKGDKAGTIRSAIAKVRLSFANFVSLGVTNFKSLVSFLGFKIHFPPEDVIRNARHFLGVVKVATGNSSIVNERQSKGGPKPGKRNICFHDP